jgi:polysaccharide biosynthesis protein PslG
VTSSLACLLVVAFIAAIPVSGSAGIAAADGQAAAAQAEPAGLQLGQTAYSDRFGVCEPHLKLHDPAGMERELREMAAAGITWARIDFAWPDLEPTRGAWNFSQADLAVSMAQSHGIRLLGILGFAPTWASGGFWMTFPPTDMPAWRNYVTTVCTRYRGMVPAWEIWNEENINQFWLPWPDANAYVALAAQAAPAIRAADPSAKVVMGGVAGLDPNYLDACFKAGIADYIDAVAFHPYVSTLAWGNIMPMEANCRFIVSWLRGLIKQYTPRPLEIWLTELGWSTCPPPAGVDPDTQGSYLARTFVNYADLGVDRVFWYNFWEEAAAPADMESNFGLLKNDFTPKPSLGYYRTFQQVFGRVVEAAGDTADFTCSAPGSLEAHCFRTADGGLVVIAWKADDLDDSLTMTLRSASYDAPVQVDPETGSEQPARGVSRADDLKLSVVGLPVGRRPAILVFSPMTTPRIASVAPASGATGAETVINGAGFGPSRGSSVATFGSTQATDYTAWSADQVRCRVPDESSGQVQLKIATTGGTSNSTQFTVTPPGAPPTLTSITPGIGAEGTTVKATLVGTGFAAGSSVVLSSPGASVTASGVNLESGGRMTCSLSFQAGQAGVYDVAVKNPDGQEAKIAGGFTVTAFRCGTGSGPAAMGLGLLMGFLSIAGLGTIRKRLRISGSGRARSR